MNKFAAARRRFRVVARPQDRARRMRGVAAVGAIVIMGGLAWAAARNAVGTLWNLKSYLPKIGGPEAAAVDGVPEPMLSLAQATADAVVGTAGEKAAAIMRAYSCVRDVRVRRAWGEKTATLLPILRRAVAPVVRRGRPAGFLGDDGVIFSAPVGVFDLTGAVVDAGDAPGLDLMALAREWTQINDRGVLHSPLVEMSWVSPDDGWQARFEDGTFVLWGPLTWTKEKLSRLSEALDDARTKELGAFNADLRWFADGKVILKPLSARVGRGAVGGVR